MAFLKFKKWNDKRIMIPIEDINHIYEDDNSTDVVVVINNGKKFITHESFDTFVDILHEYSNKSTFYAR